MRVNITADRCRGQKGYIGADLELPASSFAIADALQRAHVPEGGSYQLHKWKDCPEFLFMHLVVSGDKTLEEANLLAYKIGQLDKIQLDTYEGALQLRKNAEIRTPVTMQEMINILYNLDSYSFHPEILNDQMLGEVCLMGELLEEVKEASDELYELFSEEKVGQCLRRRDQGEYTEKGYVYCDEKTCQEFYDGQHLPEQPDIHSGIFSLRLEYALSAVPIDSGVWLELPADEKAMQQALMSLNETSYEDCLIAESKSVLPLLNDRFSRDEDVGKLNLLAQKIEAFSDEYSLAKYKAALELEAGIILDMMLDIAENLSCYDFDQDCFSPVAFGKQLLEGLGVDTSDPAFGFFDFSDYGMRGLKTAGFNYTPYGTIRRNDTPFVQEFTKHQSCMEMK